MECGVGKGPDPAGGDQAIEESFDTGPLRIDEPFDDEADARAVDRPLVVHDADDLGVSGGKDLADDALP